MSKIMTAVQSSSPSGNSTTIRFAATSIVRADRLGKRDQNFISVLVFNFQQRRAAVLLPVRHHAEHSSGLASTTSQPIRSD